MVLFPVKYAAGEEKKPDNKPEEGYEYKELPGIEGQDLSKLAHMYGQTIIKPKEEPVKSPDKPADPPKKEPELPAGDDKPINIDNMTKADAEKLVEGLEADDEVDINGEKMKKSAFLAKYDEKPAEKPAEKEEEKKPAGEKKEVKVGDKMLKPEEFDAAVKEISKEYGWDEEYVKNRKESDLVKDVAKFMKDKEKEKDRNEKGQKLAQIQRDLKRQADFLEDRVTKVEESKKNDEEALATTKKILEVKLEDMDDDDTVKIGDETYTKDELKTKKLIAREDKKKLENRIEKHKTSLGELDVQTDNLIYASIFSEIESTIPEMVLGENAGKILKDIDNNKIDDEALAQKAVVVAALADSYFTYMRKNPETKLRVEGYYRTRKHLFQLSGEAVKPKEPAKSKENEEGALKKKMLKLVSSQKNGVFMPKGGGVESSHISGTEEEKRVAEMHKKTGMVREDYNMLGVDA
jgi:hypothetical protein